MRPNSRTIFPRVPICLRRVAICAWFLVCAPGLAANAGQSVLPDSHTGTGVGSWIWDTTTRDKQTCRFWRAFEIPHSTVAHAQLQLTVDNGYRLFLDGREIGRGSDWKTLTVYDLTWVLKPGRHVLAVEAFNDRLEGGLIMGLRVELVNQNVIEVKSDENWLVVPLTASGWEDRKEPGADWHHAKVVGNVGSPPWTPWPFGPPINLAVRPWIVYFWQTGWFQIALLVTCGVAVLVCLQLMTRLAVQSRSQRLLQLERARIARDIHDDLGARLTQMVLLGEVARSELPAGSEARTQIDQVCDRARDLSHAMDEVVWAVNSRRDTLRDFVSYVCKYAQLFLASTPIRCRLDVEANIPATPFDLPVRRNLFLAVKEGLNNAAKHSGANELFLRIHRRSRGLSVVVEDNGRGFEPALIDWQRNGMTNMLQRMNEVGGECRVASAPGSGCSLEFTVPLAVESRLSRWFKRRRRSAADADLPANAPDLAATRTPESAKSRIG